MSMTGISDSQVFQLSTSKPALGTEGLYAGRDLSGLDSGRGGPTTDDFNEDDSDIDDS